MKKRLIFVLTFSYLLIGITYTSAAPLKGGVANPPINRYSNVAVVALSGGDYTDPVVAMENADSGDAWCREPGDTTTPCLLKIMPGEYDIWPNSLQMKEYVDIEGSGEKATKITSALSTSNPPTVATLRGADNAELRFLTVENTVTGPSEFYIIAILNSYASPSLLHVTATASGGTTTSIGIYNRYSSPTMMNVTASGSGGNNGMGVNNILSSPMMTNVTASGSGAQNSYGVRIQNSPDISLTLTNVTASASGGTSSMGIYNTRGSSTTLTNVTATASGDSSYGVYSDSGTVKINHSAIKGDTNSVYSSASTTMLIGNSKLEGGPVYGGPKCAGVYDGDYNFYASSCPE